MLRLFKPVNPSDNFVDLFKITFGLVTLSQLQTTGATLTTCFESSSRHDYTLSCMRGGAQIMQELRSQCGIFNDGMDDCARYFIGTMNFCKGLIAGAICEINFHNDMAPIDPCIRNVTSVICTDGFGSAEDWLSVGGVVLLMAIIGLAVAFHLDEKNRKKLTTESAERKPLLNDEEDHDHPVECEEGKAKTFTSSREESKPYQRALSPSEKVEDCDEDFNPRANRR